MYLMGVMSRRSTLTEQLRPAPHRCRRRGRLARRLSQRAHPSNLCVPLSSNDLLDLRILYRSNTLLSLTLTMNGHAMHPSRQHPSGWVAYDARDEKYLGRDPSWQASIAPSSYRQALPVYSDVGRSSSPFHRIRKAFARKLASLNGSAYPPRRTMLTRPTANNSSLSLPSTDAMRFVLLCILWYASSALSSNTGKVILNQFRYPVTLTFVQFGFVAVFCMLFMSPVVRFSRLRTPTRAILRDTFPMGCFQVGGHIFSSMAISRIPVSTVHTIKVRCI